MWPRLLNEPIIANQRTNSTFFDNYWSRESRDYYCSGLSRLRKKPETIRKSRFLQICEYLWTIWLTAIVLEQSCSLETSYQWYAFVWIVKPTWLQSKNQITPTSGLFLSNSYRPKGPWLNMPSEFRSDWSLLPVNSCLKLVWPMAAMFLRNANFLIVFCSHCTEILYTKFQVERTPVTQEFFYVYSATKCKSANLNFWTKNRCHSMFQVWWIYLILFTIIFS